MTHNLSAPILAHSSAPIPGSANHWLHTSTFAITAEAATASKAHDFSPQDRAIYRVFYNDLLAVLSQIQHDFLHDPTAARNTLNQLHHQLTALTQ